MSKIGSLKGLAQAPLGHGKKRRQRHWIGGTLHLDCLGCGERKPAKSGFTWMKGKGLKQGGVYAARCKVCLAAQARRRVSGAPEEL